MSEKTQLMDVLKNSIRSALESECTPLSLVPAYNGPVSCETSAPGVEMTVASIAFNGPNVNGTFSVMADRDAFALCAAAKAPQQQVSQEEDEAFFAFGDFAEAVCAGALDEMSLICEKRTSPQILRGTSFRFSPPKKHGVVSQVLQFAFDRGCLHISVSLY